MKTIYDYPYEELIDLFATMGYKKYRADQVFKWLYRKRATSFTMMSDIAKEMIAKLESNYYIMPLTLVTKQVAKDQTAKYLFKLADGALVETVLMHFDFGHSVCVSSQVGCNMGCKFCASGLLKKQRDLTAGEIVGQIMYIQKELDAQDQRINNVVIMGCGEPFDNYDEVMKFCRIVNHDLGLAIGARHLTISTCGLADKIKRFANEKVQYNLAISLHAPNNELRDKIMPINHAYDIQELMGALRYYSSLNNRKITFEYILLKGVNDSDECAKELAGLLKGMNAYVNLIPYNQVDEHGFKGCDDKTILHFYDVIMKNGVKATIRQKHGDDIDAACGQLRAKKEAER
ncbi:MAG: 23S rRNA (adenine(2503)-C(2))-methyltransferase RlmN [Erysipelotrichaceae bacterium]|nr:23S rRNA (adenine(2503)-C(2))-methyltransferase RlmN [Erysipelotrichaceae bacterium]MDY5252235.1 23S rRNA (adenine(2503)-C(2))-methyltransferase RlmN [Erysipelotrichaceae bacterium]